MQEAIFSLVSSIFLPTPPLLVKWPSFWDDAASISDCTALSLVCSRFNSPELSSISTFIFRQSSSSLDIRCQSISKNPLNFSRSCNAVSLPLRISCCRSFAFICPSIRAFCLPVSASSFSRTAIFCSLLHPKMYCLLSEMPVGHPFVYQPFLI